MLRDNSCVKRAVALLALALLVLPVAAASPGFTARASLSSSGAQANGHSVLPAISGDGRFVAFYSDASNLISGDTNGARDVFVRDRIRGTTTRLSVTGSGGEANSHSFAPAISADGRLVAFYSHASNLVAGDQNGLDDVFVGSVEGRQTTRVSTAPGGADANGGSYFPALSGDGRFVAFASFATNLVAADLNEVSDIFVRDRVAGTTTRVNLYPGGVEADGNSMRPSISADGSLVAFDSDAFNLVWEDTNETFDVFVTARVGGTPARVSLSDNAGEGTGASYWPALSTDGRFVAFYSEAPNLTAGDTNGAADVFLHDRASGATTRLSIDNVGAEGNGDSFRPTVSGDGRIVAFESDATNLVRGDSNRFTDVFVHDRLGTAPPPPVRCRVPRVVGLRLATARTRIRRANCRVGRVRRARSRRVGRVLSQSPRAGLTRARGTRVNLVVGRR